MSRRMRVTDRVAGTVVSGSAGDRYRRRWTLPTASDMTVPALTELRNLAAPGCERSRISRRSFGCGKSPSSLLSFLADRVSSSPGTFSVPGGQGGGIEVVVGGAALLVSGAGVVFDMIMTRGLLGTGVVFWDFTVIVWVDSFRL